MYGKTLGAFLSYSLFFAVIIILSVLGMKWAHVETAQLIDWVAGMLFFWWMLVITTVPWNVYFEARSVLHEIKLSQDESISIDDKQRKYVEKIAFWGIWLAIGLHIATAGAMFALSFMRISHIGYTACVVALLLTLLRPTIRAYDFIWQQLKSIRQLAKYPREDVHSLRRTVTQLVNDLEMLKESLDVSKPGSFAYAQKQAQADMTFKYQRLLEDQAYQNKSNIEEHERISREGREAIAKISADTEFLDHVREVIRMIKSA